MIISRQMPCQHVCETVGLTGVGSCNVQNNNINNSFYDHAPNNAVSCLPQQFSLYPLYPSALHHYQATDQYATSYEGGYSNDNNHATVTAGHCFGASTPQDDPTGTYYQPPAFCYPPDTANGYPINATTPAFGLAGDDFAYHKAGGGVMHAYDANTLKNYTLFPILPVSLENDEVESDYVSATANYSKLDFGLRRTSLPDYQQEDQQLPVEKNAFVQNVYANDPNKVDHHHHVNFSSSSVKPDTDYANGTRGGDFQSMSNQYVSYGLENVQTRGIGQQNLADFGLSTSASNKAHFGHVSVDSVHENEASIGPHYKRRYKESLNSSLADQFDDSLSQISVVSKDNDASGQEDNRDTVVVDKTVLYSISAPRRPPKSRRKYSKRNPVLTQYTVKYLKEIIDNSSGRLANKNSEVSRRAECNNSAGGLLSSTSVKEGKARTTRSLTYVDLNCASMVSRAVDGADNRESESAAQFAYEQQTAVFPSERESAHLGPADIESNQPDLYAGSEEGEHYHLNYADPNLEYSSEGSGILQAADSNGDPSSDSSGRKATSKDVQLDFEQITPKKPDNLSVPSCYAVPPTTTPSNFAYPEYAVTRSRNPVNSAVVNMLDNVAFKDQGIRRADGVRIKSPIRNRSYDFQTLQIGNFYLPENGGRRKLRFYYPQNQLVYDFECRYSYPGLNSQTPLSLLVVIIVPISTIEAVDFRSRRIIFQVNRIPRFYSGSNRDALPDILRNSNFGNSSIDVTDGQIATPFHLITLPRAQGPLIEKHFFEHSPHLRDLRVDINRYQFLTNFLDETPAIEVVDHRDQSPNSSDRVRPTKI